jgi:hypothetical protein
MLLGQLLGAIIRLSHGPKKIFKDLLGWMQATTIDRPDIL